MQGDRRIRKISLRRRAQKAWKMVYSVFMTDRCSKFGGHCAGNHCVLILQQWVSWFWKEKIKKWLHHSSACGKHCASKLLFTLLGWTEALASTVDSIVNGNEEQGWVMCEEPYKKKNCKGTSLTPIFWQGCYSRHLRESGQWDSISFDIGGETLAEIEAQKFFPNYAFDVHGENGSRKCRWEISDRRP